MKTTRQVIDDYTSSAKEAEECRRMSEVLIRNRHTFIYGGGSKSKGHGFWIQYGGETVQCADCEKYGNLNSNFWTYQALVDRFGA